MTSPARSARGRQLPMNMAQSLKTDKRRRCKMAGNLPRQGHDVRPPQYCYGGRAVAPGQLGELSLPEFSWFYPSMPVRVPATWDANNKTRCTRDAVSGCP